MSVVSSDLSITRDGDSVVSPMMDIIAAKPMEIVDDELSPMLDASKKRIASVPLRNLSSQAPINPINTNNKNNINQNGNKNSRLLTSLHYTFMLFILTAAGPYGIEPLISSSSPFYAILSLVIVPFTYCIPQSCMFCFFVFFVFFILFVQGY